jgi:HEAT repeat protein
MSSRGPIRFGVEAPALVPSILRGMKSNSWLAGARALSRGATVSCLLLIAVWMAQVEARADGCFVMPPFVWDKHKDINEPNQKAILMHDAHHEDLLLQVRYAGPVNEFGWLIPVPALPTVRKASMDCFYELSRYTQQLWERGLRNDESMGTHGGKSLGEGYEPVKVIEVKTVGAYEVVVLSASNAGSLQAWLNTNHFSFPPAKAQVMESYIQRRWYFVAVRIQLAGGKESVRGSPKQGAASRSERATARKLSQGELHPLHISFAAERCVFPLKVSSVNGRPSEVQVYVLSTQPLLEGRMFEKQGADFRRQLAQTPARPAPELQTPWRSQSPAADLAEVGALDPPVKPKPKRELSAVAYRHNEPLRYAKVTAKDLPGCAKQFTRLRGKSWWLTKQTWTFKPEEMQDLIFEPAVPALARRLAGEDAYNAACNLLQFGREAEPSFVAALQNTNARVRLAAAAAITQTSHDVKLLGAVADRWKDLEPEVRRYAAEAASNAWDARHLEPLVSLLGDPDEEVRTEAVFSLVARPDDTEQHLSVLLQLLRDGRPEARLSAFQVLYRLRVRMPREDVAYFLQVPDRAAVVMAYSYLRPQNLSCDEAAPLLRNPLMFARLLGLNFLKQVQTGQAVELAIPLLRDREKRVRATAARVLQSLTGQTIPQNQPEKWERWWAANKATFAPYTEH